MNNLNIIVNDSNASRYCRCKDRAANLIAEGYHFFPFTNDAGAYSVQSPSGNWYFVYTQGEGEAFRPHCSCPDFAKHEDFCKHLLCASQLDAEDEADMWNSICAKVEADAVEV